MTTTSVQNLYQQHIKPLNPAERLSLTAMIIQDLAEAMPKAVEARRERSLLELEGLGSNEASTQKKRSIMELHGLGAEIWNGIDAQEYVNELRKEWDHRL